VAAVDRRRGLGLGWRKGCQLVTLRYTSNPFKFKFYIISSKSDFILKNNAIF